LVSFPSSWKEASVISKSALPSVSIGTTVVLTRAIIALTSSNKWAGKAQAESNKCAEKAKAKSDKWDEITPPPHPDLYIGAVK
jgi:hypothetical protein